MPPLSSRLSHLSSQSSPASCSASSLSSQNMPTSVFSKCEPLCNSGSSWLVNYQLPSTVSKYILMNFIYVNNIKPKFQVHQCGHVSFATKNMITQWIERSWTNPVDNWPKRWCSASVDTRTLFYFSEELKLLLMVYLQRSDKSNFIFQFYAVKPDRVLMAVQSSATTRIEHL